MSGTPIAIRDIDELLCLTAPLRCGIIAIDGPCAAGKSTLAAALGNALGANVLHLDDFFLRPGQRTPERLREPGGNLDRERFWSDVFIPLTAGADFDYRPFDCAKQSLSPPIHVRHTPLSIVEGAYSLHPLFRDSYALRIFLSVEPDTQWTRILRRNGPEMAERFRSEWIPMENAYFQAFRVREICDVILSV
jgi:uridine kinase